jgi:hypothetical protein
MRLTDAQVAEVRRRIADPDRRLVSHAKPREAHRAAWSIAGGMKLVFDDQALADLENIFSWIAQDSPPTPRLLWIGFLAAPSC